MYSLPGGYLINNWLSFSIIMLLWHYLHIPMINEHLRHLRVGPTISLSLVNAGLTTFHKLEQTNPREIELVHWLNIMKYFFMKLFIYFRQVRNWCLLMLRNIWNIIFCYFKTTTLTDCSRICFFMHDLSYILMKCSKCIRLVRTGAYHFHRKLRFFI